MVGALYENWDGTGHPDHLMRGQVPLRSRILRVLIDLCTGLEAPEHPSLEAVLEDLQAHVGTRYDPMVLVHVRAVLRGAGDESVQGRLLLVPVPELQVGMILAEDLVTDSGLKLLARETRLTQTTLDLIQRRHQMEPILGGATVKRQNAA